MKDLYSKEVTKALMCLDELKASSDNFKQRLVTLWERAINFANGNQLYNYGDGTTATANGQFSRNIDVDSRQHLYVTNEIEPIARTLTSFMTRAKPAITVMSTSDEYRDRSRAKLAEELMIAKYDLDEENKNSRDAAYWALVLGTVFRKDYWDAESGSNYSLPEYDDFGNEVVDEKTGRVKTRYEKTGMNNTAILTPYSMDLDFSITDFEEIPWIRENYFMDINWVKENFYRKEPGYYNDNLMSLSTQDSNGTTGTLGYLERLKFAAPFYGRGAVPAAYSEDKTIVSEIYIRPCDTWPKGRLIITAGDKLIYDSPKEVGSPYYFEYEDINWHPYTMFTYEPWIGRFLGKGIVEQLLPLQMRLNEINGAILENANTLAKVDVLTPEGSLRRGVLNGKGANVYTYKHKPGVPPPTKWPGVPLPQQFFQERQTLIDSMVRIAGTNFVMQGQPPTGVTAASAIQQLLENANSQQSDLMGSWEKFHERAFTKKLRLIRNFNKVPDTKVINYMRTMVKDALDSEIKDFTGEDIGDGLTVKIEKGSMIPKNEQIKREQFTQFAQMGLLGNLADPGPEGDKKRAELLAKFGEKPLEGGTSVEIEKAQWENNRIKSNLPVQVGEFDNDVIHLAEHKEEFQKPKFIERGTPEMKQALYIHIKQHEQKLQMAQQQAMQAQQQQQMQIAQASNQMEIAKINAATQGEGQARMTVEQMKAQKDLQEAQMDNAAKIQMEQIKAEAKIREQLIENEGDVDKELAKSTAKENPLINF